MLPSHPPGGFTPILLTRYGKRPLAIMARALFHAHNRCAGLPDWSEFTLYETEAGQGALALAHHFEAEPAIPWRDAWLADQPHCLLATLRSQDPLAAWPLAAGSIPQGLAMARAMLCFQAAWHGLLAALMPARPGDAAP